MPCEPSPPLLAQFLPSDGSDMRNKLERLCCDLQDYAVSKTEKAYVENLRTSCAALNEQAESSSETISITAYFLESLHRYLSDCRRFLENLSSALASCVETSRTFSTRIGYETEHSIGLSPHFWLRQLHRDRFETLSPAWKSTIIKYGVAITHLQRAKRLVALCDKSFDLCEELRHTGHSNWDPMHFPETLLLEAESGIMIRREQELVARHMRLPPDADNVALQMLMGGGKSSTIIPILAAFFTDKEK